jgi:hypothetical protein
MCNVSIPAAGVGMPNGTQGVNRLNDSNDIISPFAADKPYLNRMPSPQPQNPFLNPNNSATSPVTSPNGKCSMVETYSFKAKMDYYLGIYNKLFLDKLGNWYDFQNQDDGGLTFEKMVARFLVKTISFNFNSLKNCTI